MGKEFETSEPICARTISSHSSASSDSTAPLSPDHPLARVLPTLTPTHTSFHHRTAHIAMRVPPTMMSLDLSASIAEVEAMSDLAFRKRFRFSYESLPSSSSPDLPLRKRYQSTYKLVEDDKEEEDDEEEDTEEEEEKSSKSDGEREGSEGEGPGEPLGLGYGVLRYRELAEREGEVPNTFEVGHDSGSVPEPERDERVFAFRQPTLIIWVDLEDGRSYIDVPAYAPLSPPVQTPSSPEWSSGSLTISPSPSAFPSPVPSPAASPTIPSPLASLATVEAECFMAELGARVEFYIRLTHDHAIRLDALPPVLFER
nr:hypothetical protein [Tanacetum cinerariifolium]